MGRPPARQPPAARPAPGRHDQEPQGRVDPAPPGAGGRAAGGPAWPAGAATPVFPRIPPNKTRRRDYERAGIARLDERGRQSDSHALRLTYCTMLHRQGVPPRQAMTLMRHSDARLTTQVYTDQGLLDTVQEAGKLPWVARQGGAAAGGGTDTAPR